MKSDLVILIFHFFSFGSSCFLSGVSLGSFLAPRGSPWVPVCGFSFWSVFFVALQKVTFHGDPFFTIKKLVFFQLGVSQGAPRAKAENRAC